MNSTELLICTVKGCGKPRADQSPEATNRHCRDCRKDSTKTYLLSKDRQVREQWFRKGVESMREYLATEFARFGNGQIQRFTGREISDIIRRVTAPSMPEAQAASAKPQTPQETVSVVPLGT